MYGNLAFRNNYNKSRRSLLAFKSSWIYDVRSTCGKSAGPGLNQATVAFCPFFFIIWRICSSLYAQTENYYRGSHTRWKIADMWCFRAVSLRLDVMVLAWMKICKISTSLDPFKRQGSCVFARVCVHVCTVLMLVMVTNLSLCLLKSPFGCTPRSKQMQPIAIQRLIPSSMLKNDKVNS